MTWKPDLSTREEVSGFVSDLLATLPDQLGIDEVIAGCQVLTLPAGAPPKYLNVALGGDAGPPQTGYTQAVLYRGGITGLVVGDYITVIHLREGNRYEVMGPGGAAGAAVDPAPVDAQYVTMALDGTLTDERVLTAGEWLALTDGGAGGLATLDFEPDNPVVISAAGVVTEYASIQAAITAASSCETVLVPPGTYAEDITLKDGVCVKGWGPRDKVRITGDENVVTTATGGWLENVSIILTDPDAVTYAAIVVSHIGTCRVRGIYIEVNQSTNNPAAGIFSSGANDGLLVADDIHIYVNSSGNQAVYGIAFSTGAYELELKNFKIITDNSNGAAAADAYGILQGSSCVVKATEGWLNVTATGAGTATDLFGTITYSEIVDTDDYTLFGQRVGIGMVPAHNLDITGDAKITYSPIDLHNAAALFIDIDPSATANAIISTYGLRVDNYVSVDNGFTNTGAAYAMLGFALRKVVAAQEGTMTGLYGMRFGYGHLAGMHAATTTTTTMGLFIVPYEQSGTITTRYSIYISDAYAGGTVTNRWALYVKDTADSYFAGSIGVGVIGPAVSAVLELSSTTGALLLTRMTTAQRNALTAVNGMIIYNTTTGVIEAREGGAWVNI